MSQWNQIHRHVPLGALLVGWLYARWLRLRRRWQHAPGRSGRSWPFHDAPALFSHARILE